MAKVNMLDKLDMPSKKKSEEDGSELDQELAGLGEEELMGEAEDEGESLEQEATEEGMGMASQMLAEVSDDDLLAEVKARGLKV